MQIQVCQKCGNAHGGACSTEALEFSYCPQPGQQASEVQICGDWHKWLLPSKLTRMKSQNGHPYFTITLTLSIGIHRYKYIVDGKWKHDPMSATQIDQKGNTNNVVEVLPKKSYFQKAEGSQNVKITSALNMRGLSIVGSWDGWTKQIQMEKVYNELKKREENIVYLNLQPDNTYEFKFKFGNEYIYDQSYPKVINYLGSINNFIVVYKHRIIAETPSKERSSRNLDRHQIMREKIGDGRSWTWRKMKNHGEMPYQKIEGHSLSCIGEYLYVFGGKTRCQFYNSLIKINLSFTKNEVQQVLPDGRAFHNSVVYGNKIIIYGGHNNVILDDYHAYNVSDQCWQSSMQIPRKGHAHKREMQSCVLYSNCLIFFGGYFCTADCQKQEIYNSIQVLDLQTKRWIDDICVKEDPPKGRFAHSASLIGEDMYIFGGLNSASQNTNLNDLWKINLQNVNHLSWTEVNPKGKPPCPRHGHSMNALAHFLLIFGGKTSSSEYLNDLILFNANTTEWIYPNVSGEVPRPRANHASCLFSDEGIVVYGGRTFDNAKNGNFYILTPSNLQTSLDLSLESNGQKKVQN